MTIKFGTSGWRGIMADDFTFPNVRICTEAISQEIFKKKEHNKPVIVGYDTRFLSENFAMAAAHVLADNGMEIKFSSRDVPTPVVAHEIIHSGAAGGVNITASHNPYRYNGLKFSTSWGGPAPVETTQSIEKLALMIHHKQVGIRTGVKEPELVEKLIQKSDFRPAYLKHIRGLIDKNAFRGRKLKVVVDLIHGTARGYLPDLLRELGCEVEVLRENRDVMFDGKGPDPSTGQLAELVAHVKKSKAHLGLATDGDADRFGVVDSTGRIYEANEILALLAKYIYESRGWTGIIGRSVMTTHAIDAVARKFGLEVKETPVGFKYIGEMMKEADSVMPSQGGEFIMGGEESGGFSMRGHVPEKDGILACLMVAEMVARSKKSLKDLQADFAKEIGVFMTRRVNLKATPELVGSLKEQFANKPPLEIGGLHVHRIVDIDGIKFMFHGGGWLGVRFSGTEPIIRLYLEGDSEKQLDILEKAAQTLLTPPTAKKAPKARKKAPSLR